MNDPTSPAGVDGADGVAGPDRTACSDGPDSPGRTEDTDGADPLVRLSDVRKTYDVGGTVEALAGVSLALPRGSYTAVMGPSGSGKSTLLNLVGALDTPTEGAVTVDGHDLATLSADELAAVRGTTVGFVFQTFNLLPRLDAVENVALPLVFAGWDRDERRARARDLLGRVGLGDRLDHLPTELSGGQRQRVAIARALAPDPALLLADEPTGNVDTDTGDAIMSLLGALHAEGNAVLLVTHERRVAERAERILHVRDGRFERVEALDAEGTLEGVEVTLGEASGRSPDRGTGGEAPGEGR